MVDDLPPFDPSTPIEKAIGSLYVEFLRLRTAGKIQEEYDTMGTLIGMLQKDRDHIRKTYASRGLRL